MLLTFISAFIFIALLFGGVTNPAHPKHIGSIDPTCNVADVVEGKEKYNKIFVLQIQHTHV